MRGSTRSRAGALLALAYLGSVGTLELARSSGWGPRAEDLASSPAGVLSGQEWRLLTSGFVVAGDPVVQIAATSAVVAAVLVTLGAGAFWRAAFVGHVVATLVAYAGIGVLWLVSRGDVDAVVDAPDYGISCVWAGALGVLVAGTIRRGPRSARVCALAAVAVFAAVIPFGDDLAGVEHGLAFALGALVGVRLRRQAAAADSPRRVWAGASLQAASPTSSSAAT